MVTRFRNPVERGIETNITRLVEKAGVLECISYLSRNGKATKTELIRMSSASQQSVCNALDKLVQAGLVRVQGESEFPWRKIHSLTSEGLELARTSLDSLHHFEQQRGLKEGNDIDQ